MEDSSIYIAVSIIAVALIVIFLFFMPRMKNKNKLTILAVLSIISVIAGVIFKEDRIISYTLMGVGVLLASFDMVRNRKLF